VCETPNTRTKLKAQKDILKIHGEKRGILRKGSGRRYPINKYSGSEKSLKSYDPLWRLIK
jgi:hypothetical protein